jgi:hypothetical protein
MPSDARDLRDPQKLGELLLAAQTSEYKPGTPLRVVADARGMSIVHHCPDYPQDELLSTVTQREYREELQQAAKEGDKYAAERLSELS